MITFTTIEKTNPIRTAKITITVKVMLDGKHVGTIRDVKGGWQYFPLRSKVGGEIFKYLGDCKKSLHPEIPDPLHAQGLKDYMDGGAGG